MSLSNDVITQVLGRVDGVSLANAGCVCSDFWFIAKKESMWEKACCSLWPSAAEKDVNELISSTVGGFRKFYADCFPVIAYDLQKMNDVDPDLHAAAVPSDFVSVVNVNFKNGVIYSKVVWGFPGGDDFQGWFFNSSFRIDLIHFSELEDDDHTVIHEFPTILCVEKQSKNDDVWGELVDNIRLSWIVINRRTGRAANLSSWRPLTGRKHWPSDKEYVIRFGSILPAQDILPCEAVECVIEIKCRALDSDPAAMKMTELSMQLEDMMGVHVKGRHALLILQSAAACCKRSRSHIQILKSHDRYLREGRKWKEAKMRNEGLLDAVSSISGVIALVSVSYLIFKEYGATPSF